MGEDKPVVGNEPEVVQADKDGKFPETVPWQKYVGIKEAWGKTKEKVATLEGQLKQAVNPEEHVKLKKELDELKQTHLKTSEELAGIKTKSVSEKKEFLKSKGVKEEELTGATEKELDILTKVLGNIKPKPDMSGGGGGSDVAKSTRDRIRGGFDSLHPKG